MTDLNQTIKKDALVAKQTIRAAVLNSPITWSVVFLVMGFLIGHYL